MKCKIILTVNNVPVEIEVDSTDTLLTDLELESALRNNDEQRILLALLLYSSSLLIKGIRKYSIDELLGKEGLKGNCDLNYLSSLFDVTFPEGEQADILLVNDLEIGGKKNIHGRHVQSDGRELFIVKYNTRDKTLQDDVQKLVNFLNIRKHLRETIFNISEESKYYKPFNEIIKKRKKFKLGEFDLLLLDFMYDRGSYKSITVDGYPATTWLSLGLSELMDWSMPTRYDDYFVDNMSIRKSLLDKGEAYIDFQEMKNVLKQYFNENIPEELDPIKEKLTEALLSRGKAKLLELFKEKASDDFKKKTSTEGLTVLEVLFNYLVSKEPSFTYRFNRISKKEEGFIMKSQFLTIESRYGYGYDKLNIPDGFEMYKGYHIYRYDNEGKPLYFASREYLTPQSTEVASSTLEEILNRIDNRLKKLVLRENAYIEFKEMDAYTDKDGNIIYNNDLRTNITSMSRITPGSIIEILDVPIKRGTSLILSETKIPRLNLEYFASVVKNWKISNDLKNRIINDMNTPEKALTFIYKVNERLGDNRSNEELLSSIVDLINSAKTKAYYIESAHSKFTTNNDGLQVPTKYISYRIVPTTVNNVEQYSGVSRKECMVPWIDAISKVMTEKFGVPVHRITSTEIAKLNKENGLTIDPNDSKAFIYNGEIYINSTIASTSDLLHEYVHLMLGIMKSNRDLRPNYEQLLYLVNNTTEGEQLRRTISEAYPGLSQMDLMEEVVAKEFSSYIRGDVTSNLRGIFEASEDLLEGVSLTIFDTPIGDIQQFYGLSIKSAFKRFNLEVAKLLQNKDKPSFSNTARTYSNYISQLIREHNIEEQCQ